MRNPIVPGHFDGRAVGDGDAFFNVRLRTGEVQAVYFPEDDENVSKRFVEYQVWVQHRANGTAVTKIYDHCIAVDQLGSIADFSFATYRADPSATRKDSAKTMKPGLGAKVLILCINGESTSGVIVGGIRNGQAEVDAKEDGHHMHSRFNGVDVQVNKDGEYTLTYQGAQKVDGTSEDDVDQDVVGTFVKISKDGKFTVSDKNGYNSVVVDPTGSVTVKSNQEVVVDAPEVDLGGADADQPVPKGNDWATLMGDLLTAIESITVGTAVGPSSPPVNLPQFEAIRVRLQTVLSTQVFTK